MTMSPQQWLLFFKWIVFIGALCLDWTGHLTVGQENIVETMIFSLAGVHAASFFAGKVSGVADLVARIIRLEQAMADPPLAVPVPPNVSPLSKG